MGVRGALPARYRGRPLFARTARGGDKTPIPVPAALRDEWSGIGTARCGRCSRDRPPRRVPPAAGGTCAPGGPGTAGSEGVGGGRRGVSDTEPCWGRGAPGGFGGVWKGALS